MAARFPGTWLCFSTWLFLGVADKKAAEELPEMLAKIRSGEFDNNFFDGDCLVDLAACCTKDADDCLTDLGPAYSMLTTVNNHKAAADSVASAVAFHLLRPHCGNIYLADSDFCRHCGQKREDMDPFRQFCSEVVSNVSETGFRVVSLSARLASLLGSAHRTFRREIAQLTSDLVFCRSQLSRCADLLAQQLDKEKTYRDIIQKLSESRRSAGFSDRAWKSVKQQLHEMLEAMHLQSSSLIEDGFGQLHERLEYDLSPHKS
eukprot:g15867.t1